MGKRKYQRVVLILGLLFFTMLVCFTVFHRIEKELLARQEQVMGQLITEYPELEADLIKAFEKPESLSAKADTAAGKALEEKYGYQEDNQLTAQLVRNYLTVFLALLFLTAASIIFLLLYYARKQKKQELEDEAARVRLKKLEEGNQVLLERLSKEEQETKALVTDISHQLKTPLASLRMSYEITQSDNFTMEEKKDFLAQGLKEIGKLEVLLEALLNIARLEKNMIQIKPEAAGIKKTLVSAVNNVYIKAHDRHIEIELEEFEDIFVCHDTRWTQEALVNILDNAVKYSNPETTIRIRVITMVTYITVEIADEGIGIPAADYPNIFKRFYRGHHEMVRNSEGSGVGLYLVRKIIEEQGGSVCAKPGISCGTVFLLTLPKASYKTVSIPESFL